MSARGFAVRAIYTVSGAVWQSCQLARGRILRVPDQPPWPEPPIQWSWSPWRMRTAEALDVVAWAGIKAGNALVATLEDGEG